MSWELEWDKIYKTRGEVQTDVLPTAVMAAELFKSNGVKTILDLGCGMGRHSIFFARNGFDVTAADISPKGVETTAKKAAEFNVTIKTACHDFRDIPFEDNHFDAIFCIWTTGHGTHDDMVTHASEMLRAVKPDGFIFVDYVSKDDKLYGAGKEIEKDTFINNTPGEELIPHHYSDKEEISGIYAGHDLIINPYVYHLDNGHQIKAYIVICRK